MIYHGPELQRCAANHAALSPVSILKRVERVHPELPAQIHGCIRRIWGEVAERCKRLASALVTRGVGKGDTVALIAPNIPAPQEGRLWRVVQDNDRQSQEERAARPRQIFDQGQLSHETMPPMGLGVDQIIRNWANNRQLALGLG